MFTETLLSDLVLEWGDALMKSVTQTLYTSAVFNLLIILIFTVVFIKIGMSLGKRDSIMNHGQYFLVWFLVFPVEQKPAFFYIVNTASVTVANLMQKAMYNVLTLGNTRKVLPPGFVFNSIMKAAGSDVRDPNIRANIRILVENCIPGGVTNSAGQPFSALDLFGGSIVTDSSGVETIAMNFDTSLLSNRAVSSSNGTATNCYDLLLTTRKATRAHLRAQKISEMSPQIYVGANTGDNTPGTYVTEWDQSSPLAIRMRNISINMAEANAYQRSVLRDFFSFPEEISRAGNFENNIGTMSPMTELTANAWDRWVDPTRVVVEIANTPRALARAMGLEGSIDAGMTLAKMNDTLAELPLKIATYQMWAKLLAPLVIFLLFFPRARGIVTAWSIAWFLSMLAPVVLMFTRSVANQILIWTSKLETTVPMASGHPALLNTGVNFAAANGLASDTGMLLAIFVDVEKHIWTALFMALPIAGGALAHFKGAGFLKNVVERLGTMAVTGAAGAFFRSAKLGMGQIAKGISSGFSGRKGKAAAGSGTPAAFNRVFNRGGNP
jgi:hypothetical protein